MCDGHKHTPNFLNTFKAVLGPFFKTSLLNFSYF